MDLGSGVDEQNASPPFSLGLISSPWTILDQLQGQDGFGQATGPARTRRFIWIIPQVLPTIIEAGRPTHPQNMKNPATSD